jgi:hypothetical protein
MRLKAKEYIDGNVHQHNEMSLANRQAHFFYHTLYISRIDRLKRNYIGVRIIPIFAFFMFFAKTSRRFS